MIAAFGVEGSQDTPVMAQTQMKKPASCMVYPAIGPWLLQSKVLSAVLTMPIEVIYASSLASYLRELVGVFMSAGLVSAAGYLDAFLDLFLEVCFNGHKVDTRSQYRQTLKV